jgi:N-acetylmuramidase/Putative peptidoglycan binding domain
MNFVGAAKPLVDADITQEAQLLGCDPAAVWAVCDVESASSGFLPAPDNRPQILFEAHVFSTLTQGQYDGSYPNISSPYWNQSLYGAGGAHQYDRLDIAIGLNQDAGLESASWGRFQIMGSNYKMCGYSDVVSYVQAMMADELNHLKAFGAFCNSGGITRYLVDHDWSHFALLYNGSGQVSYYAGKLAAAFAARGAGGGGGSPLPASTSLQNGSSGQAVVDLQNDLNKLGASLTADGNFGPATEAAVKQFQAQHYLNTDGVVGPLTMAAITAAVAKVP